VIPNVVLVANGKGGVYKTSLVANLAVLAARGGWRVLAVDLDPQGNLARDLGYMDQSDGGAELLTAVTQGRAAEPMRGVREHLDVLAGGPSTDDLLGLLTSKAMRGDEEVLRVLEHALAPITPDYHLVLFDIGPSQSWLHRAAMTTARPSCSRSTSETSASLPVLRTPRSVSHAWSLVITQSGTGCGPRWVPRSA
jgi:chromosome partitioning protein